MNLFSKMRFIVMFVTAVCVLFLEKEMHQDRTYRQTDLIFVPCRTSLYSAYVIYTKTIIISLSVGASSRIGVYPPQFTPT